MLYFSLVIVWERKRHKDEFYVIALIDFAICNFSVFLIESNKMFSRKIPAQIRLTVCTYS